MARLRFMAGDRVVSALNSFLTLEASLNKVFTLLFKDQEVLHVQ